MRPDDCRHCGHPADAHDCGGTECWTTADNQEKPDLACMCSWYEPRGE